MVSYDPVDAFLSRYEPEPAPPRCGETIGWDLVDYAEVVVQRSLEDGCAGALVPTNLSDPELAWIARYVGRKLAEIPHNG